MSRHSMLCIAKVFGGKFFRENFAKWCNLVRLGVYFDQMILKIIPKITIFKLKLTILPTHLLYGVFKLPEKILKT